jgi:uncharacterized protein (DUF1330 family)
MFNALWFKSEGGAERYAEYGAAVQPIMADVGAELLFPFMTVERSLEGGLDPDMVAFIRYPSVEAFDEMWKSDAYQRVAHLRQDAMTKAILTRCVIDPAGPLQDAELAPGIAVLNALWFRPGGAATYARYLEQAEPLVQSRGGHFVLPRLLPQQSLAEDFVPDLMFLGYYPSNETLFEFVNSTAYQPAAAVRAQAVDHSATTILRIAG